MAACDNKNVCSVWKFMTPGGPGIVRNLVKTQPHVFHISDKPTLTYLINKTRGPPLWSSG